MKPYPEQVCFDCANPVKKLKELGQNTVWAGKCDVCGMKKGVSSPGDYGWPDFRGFRTVKRRVVGWD